MLIISLHLWFDFPDLTPCGSNKLYFSFRTLCAYSRKNSIFFFSSSSDRNAMRLVTAMLSIALQYATNFRALSSAFAKALIISLYPPA